MSSADDARARHERMQRLFLEARGLEELARAAFLDEACAEDPALRAEIEQLLAHDRPATAGDEEPDSPLRSELDALRQQAEKLSGPVMPECIGEYRLLRKLGEGGMGTVYEARQEKLQRTVALKVMRLSSFSAQSLRRFEKEGEFLGRLEHPGIARIYDSGRADTPFGPQPYFAMELVDGVPLTEYARSRELSLHERLELIVRVADAVQYAHRQGVIHRDL
ncbi:MAG: putative Ser/Thr protein kinase, partial [Candidatus Paceibacteria bacterium]